MERQLNQARRALQANDYAGCETACRSVLAKDPNQLDALRLLGVTARHTTRLPLSLELLSQATPLAEQRAAKDARFTEVAAVLNFEWATTLDATGNPDAALAHYQRAISYDPRFFEAHINAAALLEKAFRFQQALPLIFKAAELNPQSATALYNLGNVLRELGHIEHAARSYRQSLAIRSEASNVHMNLSTCLLLLRQFEVGWQEYEYRGPSGEVTIDQYPQPRWQGESLVGKTLLIHAEQGIGDEIMFSSCFAEVIRLATRVILICEPRLVTLFARSFPTARVIGWSRSGDGRPAPVDERYDLQIPAGSLPLYLRPSLAHFPQRANFLQADAAQVDAWRQRLCRYGDGPKIGISWRAGGKPGERRRRTTELAQWQELLTLPGVQWVNLQYGECGNDLAEAQNRWGVNIIDPPEGDPLTDIDGFAAKLTALDAVISVGNATAHLAGALGVKTWVMLPRVPAWRWQISGDSSSWYSSVQLLRQTSEGWDDVIAQAAAGLKAHCNLLATESTIGSPIAQTVVPLASAPTDFGLNVNFAAGPLAIDVLPAALQAAIEHFERQQHAPAEAICRNILLHAPRYFDAQHLLGVIAYRSGRLEMAERCLRRAIAVCDGTSLAHLNLGHVLRDRGTIDAAADCYAHAVRRDGKNSNALLALGNLQFGRGHHAAAADCFSRVLALNVESAEIWFNLATSRRSCYQTDAAIDAYRHALRLQPTAKAHAALGSLLAEDGLLEDSLPHLRAAAHLEPRSADHQCQLGKVLRETGQSIEAQDCIRRAAKIDPASYDAWYFLADALRAEGRSIEAIDGFRRAAAIRNDDPQPHHQLGRLLHDLGRLDEALACYDRAIERNPQLAPARFHRGLLRLQLGDLAAGWRDYEWRWHSGEGARPRDYFSQPLWDGSSLAGKTILIHGEQGVGDEVMFASCLPEMIAQAGRVIVLCQPRLLRLFARSFPQARVESQPRGFEHLWRAPRDLRFDLQIPAGSLPRYLRTHEKDFARSQHFLHADSPQQAAWQARLAELGPGLKVGISWRAGVGPDEQHARSTPIESWLPVLQTAGAHFIDLQHGEHTADLLAARQFENVKIHRWSDADPLGDLDRFAAQISALDLVISVGNATVHLAGALGVPTWNLLPTFGGWRWPRQGEEARWYRSVRVLRQPQPCAWEPLMAEVAQRLGRRIAEQTNRVSA